MPFASEVAWENGACEIVSLEGGTLGEKIRNPNAEFKVRVAMEAIKGLKTVQEIAAENHVHPTQITQ